MVDVDEWVYVYLGIFFDVFEGGMLVVVVLYGMFVWGKDWVVGFVDNLDKVYFDYLCWWGYVVIVLDYFVVG